MVSRTFRDNNPVQGLSGIQHEKHELIHATTLNLSFSVGGTFRAFSHQYGYKESPNRFNPNAQSMDVP